jgi:DNA replicative helicase MCM subunit Mcm2 (Cdc46/Mcm family)
LGADILDGGLDGEIYGRSQVVADLTALLREQSVLMSGPRRQGKSTVLRYLAATQPRSVYVDLQAASGMEGLRAALRPLERPGMLDRLAATWQRLHALGEEPEPTFQLLREVLRGLDEPVRLLLDEIPLWIDTLALGERAPALYGLASLCENARVLLAGSIDVAAAFRQYGCGGALRSFEEYPLPPLPVADGAALFFSRLPDGTVPKSDVDVRIHRLAGGSPHWIRRLAARTTSAGWIGAEEVQSAAERLCNSQEFDLELEHLTRRHPRHVAALRAGLTAAVDGAHRTAVLQAIQEVTGDRREASNVIDLLVREMFLVEDRAQTLRFVTPLFERYWAGL